jgi:hypothetical protein
MSNIGSGAMRSAKRGGLVARPVPSAQKERSARRAGRSLLSHPAITATNRGDDGGSQAILALLRGDLHWGLNGRLDRALHRDNFTSAAAAVAAIATVAAPAAVAAVPTVATIPTVATSAARAAIFGRAAIVAVATMPATVAAATI